MLGVAARGALAAGAATWLMDQVTSAMMASQGADVTEQERAAQPHGRTALANLAARLETTAGMTIDDGQRGRLLTILHYGLGIVPGALYAVLRHRLGLPSGWRGVVYGLLVWALNDEALNSALGLSGAFDDYPIQTHVRGAIGHVVLGVTTDTGIDLLGG